MKNRILTIIFSLFILIFMNINVYAREDIGLKDGFYKVNISLWHSTEDKASMGNRAMNQSAQIEVKDNKIMLYMESEKIKIQDIESSMLNFYTLDSDKNYKKAEEACYEIEIKNEKSKRPRLFRINLYKKDTFTDVLIDPKVEVMGKDPIKARLKINWDSLEEIKEDEASFIRDFKNDLKENKKEADFKEDNEVLLYYTDKSFNEDFDFSVKKLTENEKFDLKNYNFNDFTAYKVKISKKLNIIPGDFKGLIDYLREDIKPSDEINIKIPLKDNKSINLYKIHDSKKIRLC